MVLSIMLFAGWVTLLFTFGFLTLDFFGAIFFWYFSLRKKIQKYQDNLREIKCWYDVYEHTYSMKQSAVAMRKRMSDDTNKYNFNRKRVLDRIREGSIPQQNTTKKYDISNAEVNAIRKEGNHPPLVVAFAPSAYAPKLAVNEETKRIQEQLLEILLLYAFGFLVDG